MKTNESLVLSRYYLTTEVTLKVTNMGISGRDHHTRERAISSSLPHTGKLQVQDDCLDPISV